MTHPIANEIFNQLGGNKFVAMTGASGFVMGETSLTFKLKKGGICRPINKAHGLRITLQSDDTYCMEFFAINRKLDVLTVSKHVGIYCDMLTEMFETATGLRTSLER